MIDVYAIVDQNNQYCEHATTLYKSKTGAKNAFNRARECWMQKWMWQTYGLGVKNDFTQGWYKWVFKSHLDPRECVGKNFDPGLGNTHPLTAAEADALGKKWHEFNQLYNIREVEMLVNIK